MLPSRLDIERVLRETFVAHAEYYAVTTSTNDRALACSAEPQRDLPILIVADQQTAGRGRGSNRWWTGPGSLAFSLLVEPLQVGADRPQRASLVGLMSALAIVDTVAPLLPSQPIGIHWPNDVFAAGGKLAGILVEVLHTGRHVVGIGVNTNSAVQDAPSELQQSVVTLRDLSGRVHDQTTLLVALLKRIERGYDQLRCQPDEIGLRADALCLQRDRTLTLRLGDQTVTGRCIGIARDGGLVLENADGRRTFFSGTLV